VLNTIPSAVFNFYAIHGDRFYKALRAGDKETVTAIIKDFFIPFLSSCVTKRKKVTQ